MKLLALLAVLCFPWEAEIFARVVLWIYGLK
jgi:hypothetical protein